MSEKFTSAQERRDTTSEITDFVNVDDKGRAHAPTGSGRHTGKFLSDHEVKMIAAHADQIHEGDSAREAQNVLHSAVGDLTDPAHIRENLFAQGYIDEEEYEGDDPWTDEEIMRYVQDAQSEAVGHDSAAYRERLAERLGGGDEPQEYVPKHRAYHANESAPLFEELAGKYEPEQDSEARDGESLNEYEARTIGGRHRAETGANDLELLSEGAVSAADLEILDESNDSSVKRRGFVARMRNAKNRARDLTTRVAAEASARSYTRNERSGDRRNGALIAMLGGAAVVAVLRMRGHDVSGLDFGGGSKTGAGGGDAPWQDYLGNKQPISPSHGGNGGGHGHETVSKIRELFGNGNVSVKSGDGYTQVMDRVLDSHNVHLSSNELYDLHKHLEHVNGEYIDLHGANDTYAMANGDSGLTHPDSMAHISKSAQKATVDWLERHGKIA